MTLVGDGLPVELAIETSFEVTGVSQGNAETASAGAGSPEQSSDPSAQSPVGDPDNGETVAADSEPTAADAAPSTPSQGVQPRSPAVSVTRLNQQQATRNLELADTASTQRTVSGLNLPASSNRSTPSPQQISGFLQQLRQRVANP